MDEEFIKLSEERKYKFPKLDKKKKLNWKTIVIFSVFFILIGYIAYITQNNTKLQSELDYTSKTKADSINKVRNDSISKAKADSINKVRNDSISKAKADSINKVRNDSIAKADSIANAPCSNEIISIPLKNIDTNGLDILFKAKLEQLGECYTLIGDTIAYNCKCCGELYYSCMYSNNGNNDVLFLKIKCKKSKTTYHDNRIITKAEPCNNEKK